MIILVHLPVTPKPFFHHFFTRGVLDVRVLPMAKRASSLDTQSPSLQAVRNRPPPRRPALRERRAATKRSRRGPVPHSHNADILNAPNCPLTRHARRHLYRQRKILARCE